MINIYAPQEGARWRPDPSQIRGRSRGFPDCSQVGDILAVLNPQLSCRSGVGGQDESRVIFCEETGRYRRGSRRGACCCWAWWCATAGTAVLLFGWLVACVVFGFD